MRLILQIILLSTYWQEGIKCFLLFSFPPSSEDDHITVCPGSSVTLTCSASRVGSLAWRDQNRDIGSFVPRNPVSMVIVEGPYTLTLVDKDGDSMVANFTSTLEVNVNDINNGTNISCAVFMSQRYLIIYSQDLPHPPIIVKMEYTYFQNNFSVEVSWESEENEPIDEFHIQSENCTLTTNATSIIYGGIYNVPFNFSLWAVNCAGKSLTVTKEMFVEGCGPPISPFNGSVNGWSSSQVGAEIIYTCNDLVLVGDNVATCSSSLEWLPSHNDVLCPKPLLASMTVEPSHAASATPVTFPPTNTHPLFNTTIVVTSSCVLGAVTILLFITIVLVLLLSRKRKHSGNVQDNWYSPQEGVRGPAEAILPTNSYCSPSHLPVNSTSDGFIGVYSKVMRETPSSGNEVSSRPTYESIEPNRKLIPSDSLRNVGAFTTESREQQEMETYPTIEPEKETYAQLLFKEARKETQPPLPLYLEEPVQYSTVQTKSPIPRRDCSYAHSFSQPAIKHPLGVLPDQMEDSKTAIPNKPSPPTDQDHPDFSEEYLENEMPSSPTPSPPPPLAPEDVPLATLTSFK